jgi:hypothetical protein
LLNFLSQKFDPNARKGIGYFFGLGDPRREKKTIRICDIFTSDRFGQTIWKIRPGIKCPGSAAVLHVIGQDFQLDEMEDSMERAAKLLRKALKIKMIFIHGTKISSPAMDEKSVIAKGYFVENPKTLSGAGNRYNAGFWHYIYAIMI